MTKILLLIDNLEIGGAQKIIYQYIQQLHQKEVDYVVCNLGNESHYSRIFTEMGVPVYNLNGSRFNLWVIFKILKIIRRERIDLVHANLIKSNFLAAVIGTFNPTPILIHEHSSLEEDTILPYFRYKLLYIVYRWLYLQVVSSVRIIFCITEEIRQQYQLRKPLIAKKLKILPNFIDTQEFLTVLPEKESIRKAYREQFLISNDHLVMITVGRLSKEKGHRYLLEAISLLKTTRPVCLFIVGGGVEFPSLAEEINRKHLSKCVQLLGLRTDIMQLLCMSDLFVLPSLKEPFGIVLLEAMILKVPVMVTNTGGPNELIQDGNNGIKVAVKDPLAMAQAIDRFSNHQLDGDRIRENAFKMTKDTYDIQKNISQLKATYLEVLNSNR